MITNDGNGTAIAPFSIARVHMDLFCLQVVFPAICETRVLSYVFLDHVRVIVCNCCSCYVYVTSVLPRTTFVYILNIVKGVLVNLRHAI